MSGSDDWQPGDLALCIKQGAWAYAQSGNSGDGPRAGEVCTVRAVATAPSGFLVLWFYEWPGHRFGHSFRAYRFCKIRPHTPDAEDAETIRLLAGKPAKVTA